MGESKEIPAEILNDVAFAINNFGGLSSNAADDLAVLVIEAAQVPEMLTRIAAYEEAIQEAEAILGGEYGDHFGAFMELVSKAREVSE